MRDGSDAVADWPILNALVNTACGASWVSFHHGGGVGMGKSIHAGQVIVADGTPEAAERIERVLTADPGHGRRAPRRRRATREAIDAARAARRPHADARPRARRVSDLASTAPRRCCARPSDGLPVPAPRPRRRAARSSPARSRCADGAIAALRGRRRRRRCASTRRGCAVVPGFVDCHTHLPFAGWRAEEYEMKVTGVPYEEIARSGGGIRVLGARARRGDATTRCSRRRAALAARDARPRARRRSSPRAATGCRATASCARCGWRPTLGEPVAQTTRSTALLAHAVPDGFDADGWMDEVEALAGRLAARTRRDGARHLRRVRRLHERAPRAARASSPPSTALALRAHVEQFNAQPLGAGRARRRRAVGRPPRLPAPRRPRAAGGAPSAPRCCCPAPSSSAPSAVAPGARAGRRRRDLRAGHRLQPGHVAGRRRCRS